MRRVVAAVLAACALMSLASGPALACVPTFPTFADIIATDSTIVLGTVVEKTQPEPYPAPPHATIEVERVLRGRAGERIVVKEWANFCRSTLPLGERVIVVVSMAVGDPDTIPNHPLAPYILMAGGEPHGQVEEIPHADSLDELADRIAAVPDTATDGREPAGGGGVWWLALASGLGAGLLLLARPPWSRHGRQRSIGQQTTTP